MQTQPKKLPTFIVAVILATGAGVAWAIAVSLCSAIIDDAVRPADEIRFRQLGVQNDDNTPVIRLYLQDGRTHYVTLDGTAINASGVNYLIDMPAPLDQRDRDKILGWPARIAQVYGTAEKVWYFVHGDRAEGRGYFVGYDSRTNRRIGYIGRAGFRSTEPPPEDQFSTFVRWSANNAISYLPCEDNLEERTGVRTHGFPLCPCLVTDDGLMLIELDERAVKPLYRATGIFWVAVSHEPGPIEPQRSVRPPTILARMPDQIVILGPSGQQLQAFQLPAELRDSSLGWIQLTENEALVRKGEDLYWVQPDGKIVRHEHVALLEPTPKSAARTAFDDVLVPGASVPSPSVITGFIAVRVWNRWNAIQDESLSYFAALGQALWQKWPTLLLTSIISIVLAWFTYRRQRRYGMAWTGMWTGFVLLFGLPAYFGYLAHRSWPARLACPSCGCPAPCAIGRRALPAAPSSRRRRRKGSKSLREVVPKGQSHFC